MATPEFYIDGIPMRVSKSFEPIFLDDCSLPMIPSVLRYDVNYDFQVEKFALKECERRDEEIFKEADRVRRRLEEEEKMKQSISDIKTKEKQMRLPFPLSSTPFSTVTSPLSSAGLIASTPLSMATTTGAMATTTGTMAATTGTSRETSIVSNGVHPSPSDIVKPMNRINLSDFESSNSSPFDDALLRAIDDRQELNHIFNHHNHRQDK